MVDRPHNHTWLRDAAAVRAAHSSNRSAFVAELEQRIARVPVPRTRQERDALHKLELEAIGPVGPACTNLESFGDVRKADGEYRVCGLSRVRPPCTIVSLGSREEWSFELDAAARTPCDIHTFDCTLRRGAAPPPELRNRTTLHPLCVGLREYTHPRTGWRYVPWASLVQQTLNLTAPPALLKMDIEGFEWEVLPALLLEDAASALLVPQQIAMEIHIGVQPPHTLGRRTLPREFIHVPPSNTSALFDDLWGRGRYVVASRLRRGTASEPATACCSSGAVLATRGAGTRGTAVRLLHLVPLGGRLPRVSTSAMEVAGRTGANCVPQGGGEVVLLYCN